MKIIAFVGMPASGKGEAATVAKELGYPVVNMGDVIREEALLVIEKIKELAGF